MKIDKRLLHVHPSNQFFPALACLLTVFALLISSCGKEEEAVTEEVARPAKIMTIAFQGDVSVRKLPGKVRASQRVDLAFKVSGPLIELPIEEGHEVKKGEVIARILPRDFKTNLVKAKARALEAKQQYKRYKDLYIKKQVSKADFDRYKSENDVANAGQKETQDALEDTYLRAPFSGVVAKKYVENFQEVQAKQSIVSLQDLSHIEILVDVPEIIMATARKKGSHVAFAEFAANPGKHYPLSLKEYSTEADPQTQTYRAVLEMPAPEGINILPGMTATVIGTVELGEGVQDAPFLVSVNAVFADEADRQYVWVVNPETMLVKRREVKVGSVTGKSIRILDGLLPNERIVTAGVDYLQEGMKVREIKGKIGD